MSGESTLYFAPSSPDDAIRWAQVSASREVLQDGRLGDAEAPQAGHHILIVPGEAVTLARIDVPSGTRVQIEAAARLLVADLVAGDLTTKHMSVAAKPDADGMRYVAIAELSDLRRWLNRLSPYGVDPDRILPAPLLLEAPETGAITGPYDGLMLARSHERAFAAEPDLVDVMLADGSPISRLDGQQIYHMLCRNALAPPLNLRSGAFAKAGAGPSGWRPFRLIAGLGVAMLLAFLILPFAEALKYQRLARDYDERAYATVREALPNAPRIVNARAQLRERLDELGVGRSSLAARLSALSNAVLQTPGTSVQSLNFTPGEGVDVSLNLATPGQADAVKAALESVGERVEVGAARMTQDGARATIRLGGQQ